MKHFIPFIALLVLSCTSDIKQNEVTAVGAMKNVMWKGELEGLIQVDTISPKEGLYGLGPLEGLRGEIMINDGEIIVSKIDNDQRIYIEKNVEASAPFFVYAHNSDWVERKLTDSIKTDDDIETYLNTAKGNYEDPFVFKLKGEISSATLHVQNLAEGTRVTNPKEAHQGQVDFQLDAQPVEIIGFYSTRHQRVFTHHDRFIHMHVITADGKIMGHLDAINIDAMMLYLPEAVAVKD